MSWTNKNKKSSRIAFYLPSLRGGGAERTTLNLANGFARRGYKVDLILVKAEGEYLSDVNKNINLINLNASRTLKSLLKLIKYLRLNRPQTIISALHHANIICFLAVKISGVNTKVILTARNIFSSSTASENKIRLNFFKTFMRFCYSHADHVVGISKEVIKDLKSILNISGDHFKVIYNPVIDNSIDSKLNEDFHHPWYLHGEPPVILAVGRLEPIKDYNTLIYAFHKVKKEIKGVRLLILGEGSQRKELENLINKLNLTDSIQMPGFVKNPYIYMKKSALLVHSAIAEGFCNVIVEAMYCGTSVVATNGPGGPKEILENGKYGFLVPVGNTNAMARAIIQTLNKKNESKILKERSKEFTVDRILDQYESFIGRDRLYEVHSKRC